jgi:hypothetical protein
MQTRNITISDRIEAVCPDFHLAVIACEVQKYATYYGLWEEIDTFCSRFPLPTQWQISISVRLFMPRGKYIKKLGKDPNRYRPSSEALCRRILKGQELYQINTLVDLINLVSLETGYSIGGFDDAKIRGGLTLGVGEAEEKFEGIGRGLLNIEGLPVYRDDIGVSAPLPATKSAPRLPPRQPDY